MNKIFRPVQFDEIADVTLSGAPLAPRRKRGRPRGSVAQVVQQPISADDIAFLRSIIQGVSPQAAAKLYLAHRGDVSERSGASRYYEHLRMRIEAAASTWPELAKQVDVVWGRAGGLPEKPTVAEPQVVAPLFAPAATVEKRMSLEDFAAQYPEDMYSERELLELYLEEFPEESVSGVPGDAGVTASAKAAPERLPAEAASAKYSLSDQLAALAWMDRRLAVRPSRNDEVLQWIEFTSVQAQALKEKKVTTLAELRVWMAVAGARWWDCIPRYGRLRGKRLIAWLDHHGIDPEASLSQSKVDSGRHGPEKTALVPFEQMVWPDALRGERGGYRSDQPNTLGASSDIQAVQAWFATLEEKTAATRKAYKRATERLALWALMERGVAISALTTQDIEEFFSFLQDPPDHWVQSHVRTRMAQDWRPLKGALNDASQQLTSAAVRRLFALWHAAGYLRINPTAQLQGNAKRQVKLDVMRSFSAQDKTVIRQTLEGMENGPRKRRLVALIRLLQTAGLRRAECANMTWKQLEKVSQFGSDAPCWTLKIKGHGERERVVPIHDLAYAALEDHRNDRLALIETGALSMYADIAPLDMPLIGILDERLAQHAEKSEGVMPHNARREANETGSLSSGRIYGVLKDFFVQCANRAGAANSDFMAASTHWLRHTYAHDSLQASANDVRMVQQLLGHSDINTTTMYLPQDVREQVLMVSRIVPIV
ncbi:tyrosine-type recombinase/integrase (plasmid) [Diaphorobacter sp. HDW4B]|uniref:tyrosine-type recombinase/integrase n=1 Tax=Diaphorobacter sp. HDW4B TaxID=2714925 RepID=UPI00140BF907|nr:tyrosine-type recombinase/integrase [Diaphorobacter sp. HDW4B]QIL73940.1 tyrosine-type recombinase/integrase [Diaphorobacter sp. HDW4B]